MSATTKEPYIVKPTDNWPLHPPGCDLPSPLPFGKFPSASSASSAVKQIDSRPAIELIVERQILTAVLLPRELTQAQLLIAEFLVKGHWRLRTDLADIWRQWRVYAPPFWMACPEATQPTKPTGPKLFFA